MDSPPKQRRDRILAAVTKITLSFLFLQKLFKHSAAKNSDTLSGGRSEDLCGIRILPSLRFSSRCSPLHLLPMSLRPQPFATLNLWQSPTLGHPQPSATPNPWPPPSPWSPSTFGHLQPLATPNLRPPPTLGRPQPLATPNLRPLPFKTVCGINHIGRFTAIQSIRLVSAIEKSGGFSSSTNGVHLSATI